MPEARGRTPDARNQRPETWRRRKISHRPTGYAVFLCVFAPLRESLPWPGQLNPTLAPASLKTQRRQDRKNPSPHFPCGGQSVHGFPGQPRHLAKADCQKNPLCGWPTSTGRSLSQESSSLPSLTLCASEPLWLIFRGLIRPTKAIRAKGRSHAKQRCFQARTKSGSWIILFMRQAIFRMTATRQTLEGFPFARRRW